MYKRQLYTQLQKAQDNVRALNTTIELSEELVRIRKKSFAEGMATSTEVASICGAKQPQKQRISEF